MNTLLIAARKPLFLLVVVVAIITGLFVEMWLLPLGIIVYLTAVVLASRDTQLVARVAQQSRQQNLSSPTFLAKVKEIERVRGDVLRALKRTGGPVEARLAPSIEPQTRDLLQQAYTLAARGQDIEQYLEKVNFRHLQDRINHVDQRIAQTSDQYTIGQLESTRQALQSQLQNAQILETYIGRINSQLENINANLGAMPAQFMRMQATDVDTSMASTQIEQSLNDMSADMNAFVSMLDNALNQTRTVAP